MTDDAPDEAFSGFEKSLRAGMWLGGLLFTGVGAVLLWGWHALPFVAGVASMFATLTDGVISAVEGKRRDE